jgi:hypothetical protein
MRLSPRRSAAMQTPRTAPASHTMVPRAAEEVAAGQSKRCGGSQEPRRVGMETRQSRHGRSDRDRWRHGLQKQSEVLAAFASRASKMPVTAPPMASASGKRLSWMARASPAFFAQGRIKRDIGQLRDRCAQHPSGNLSGMAAVRAVRSRLTLVQFANARRTWSHTSRRKLTRSRTWLSPREACSPCLFGPRGVNS